MVTLIKITTYLLKQQLRQLEIAFVKEGGLRERMTRARIEERKRSANIFSDHQRKMTGLVQRAKADVIQRNAYLI